MSTELKEAWKAIDDPDLSYNRDPVCPHCGYIMQDAWELHFDRDGDETEVECYRCDKKYKIIFNLEVTYSTEKL